MFRGRDPNLPRQWEIIDGHICPLSFCSIQSGMDMFRDAHHYFYLISKNIEANAELSVEIGGEDKGLDRTDNYYYIRRVR